MPDPVSTLNPVEAYVASILAALGDRDPMVVLADTPDALRRSVSDLTPEQVRRPEAPGKWSLQQVVSHLADSELVGGFRFRMVLAQDRPILPGYDQDLWADRLHYQEADLAAALDDFASLRRSNLRLLARATAADLKRVMAHAERGDESLARMIRLYAGHDRVHLAQMARIRRALGVPAVLGAPAE